MDIEDEKLEDLRRGQRLKEVMEKSEYNQTTLSLASGESQPNISNYITGKSPISPALLAFLVKEKNVNANYILTGEGEPYLSNKNNSQLAKENAELKKENTQMREITVSEVVEVIQKNFLKYGREEKVIRIDYLYKKTKIENNIITTRITFRLYRLIYEA